MSQLLSAHSSELASLASELQTFMDMFQETKHLLMASSSTTPSTDVPPLVASSLTTSMASKMASLLTKVTLARDRVSDINPSPSRYTFSPYKQCIIRLVDQPDLSTYLYQPTIARRVERSTFRARRSSTWRLASTPFAAPLPCWTPQTYPTLLAPHLGRPRLWKGSRWLPWRPAWRS